jgi:hypothetical protein
MHFGFEHKSTLDSPRQSRQMILDPLRGVRPQLSQEVQLVREEWLEVSITKLRDRDLLEDDRFAQTGFDHEIIELYILFIKTE